MAWLLAVSTTVEPARSDMAPWEGGAAVLQRILSPDTLRVPELALRRRPKLSGYGLFRVDDDRLLGSRSAEDSYAAVGMPWIRQTLSEDRGEIEVVVEGALPEVVEPANVCRDLPVHTDRTDKPGLVVPTVASVDTSRLEGSLEGVEEVGPAALVGGSLLFVGVTGVEQSQEGSVLARLECHGDTGLV